MDIFTLANDLRTLDVRVSAVAEATAENDAAVHLSERVRFQIAPAGDMLNVVRALADEDGVIMYPDREAAADLLHDIEWAMSEDTPLPA